MDDGIVSRIRRLAEWLEFGANLKTLAASGVALITAAWGIAEGLLGDWPLVPRFLGLLGLAIVAVAAVLALLKLLARDRVQGVVKPDPAPYLTDPGDRRRFVAAMRALKTKQSNAAVRFSDVDFRGAALRLVEALSEAGWSNSHSELPTGGPPLARTEVAGSDSPLVANVVAALANAGFPDVRAHIEPIPAPPFKYEGRVQIALGYPAGQ
jgi:hypothetical protein